MLDVFDGLGILGGGTHVAQHVQQRLRPLDTLAGMLLEEIKKAVLLREKRAKGHRSLPAKMSECGGANVAAPSRLLYRETRFEPPHHACKSPTDAAQPSRGA